jgi:hypothetical protein
MKPLHVPAVSVRVGSLALHGYSNRDGMRLAGAFEKELGRLLATAPLAAHGLETDVLRLPRFRRSANESPERVGRRLARSIVEALAP